MRALQHLAPWLDVEAAVAAEEQRLPLVGSITSARTCIRTHPLSCLIRCHTCHIGVDQKVSITGAHAREAQCTATDQVCMAMQFDNA